MSSVAFVIAVAFLAAAQAHPGSSTGVEPDERLLSTPSQSLDVPPPKDKRLSRSNVVWSNGRRHRITYADPLALMPQIIEGAQQAVDGDDERSRGDERSSDVGHLVKRDNSKRDSGVDGLDVAVSLSGSPIDKDEKVSAHLRHLNDQSQSLRIDLPERKPLTPNVEVAASLLVKLGVSFSGVQTRKPRGLWGKLGLSNAKTDPEAIARDVVSIWVRQGVDLWNKVPADPATGLPLLLQTCAATIRQGDDLDVKLHGAYRVSSKQGDKPAFMDQAVHRSGSPVPEDAVKFRNVRHLAANVLKDFLREMTYAGAPLLPWSACTLLPQTPHR